MRNLTRLNAPGPLQNINLENTIRTVANNIYRIINNNNISIERISASGLAAIASMGVSPAGGGGPRILWELFNPPGLLLPVPAVAAGAAPLQMPMILLLDILG